MKAATPSCFFTSMMLFIALMFLPCAAMAQEVYCAGSSPDYPEPYPAFVFTSLNDAVHSPLYWGQSYQWVRFKIHGTCTESVDVTEYSAIELVGVGEAKLVSPGDGRTALQIHNSHGKITNLRFESAGTTGILVALFDSRIEADNCVFSRAGNDKSGTGLLVYGLADVKLDKVAVSGFRTGIGASQNSVVTLMGRPGEANCTIEGNRTGIKVESGSLASLTGSNVLQNNSDYAIDVENAHLVVSGRATVQGNTTGLRLRDATAKLDSASDPDPARGIRLVNNRGAAIVHSAGADAYYSMINVSGNGTAPCGAESAAIFVQIGSKIDLYNSSVTGNACGGMFVIGNSSTRIMNTSLTGNGSFGVSLLGLSFAGVGSTTISGNVSTDLVCSDSSEVSTDSATVSIGTVLCKSLKPEKTR